MVWQGTVNEATFYPKIPRSRKPAAGHGAACMRHDAGLPASAGPGAARRAAIQEECHTMFDASAARALARKSVDLLDFMVSFKAVIVGAAERGALVAVAPLPEPVPVPEGVSQDASDFLLTLFRVASRPVHADAVRQAIRAGYALRPVWSTQVGRPGVAGIEFDWSKEAPPMSGSEAPMLLPAAAALALSQQARGPVLWVERALGDVRRAAEAGRFECVLRDPLDSAAAEWTARRELLRQAGFRLELQRAEEGTQATIAW